MTQEEQDAILGRTLREYNDCSRQIGAIEAALSKVGQELSRLGETLIHHPENALFAGRAHDMRFGRGPAYSGGPSPEIFQAEAIDGNSIAGRVAELQQCHLQKDNLGNRLESLGHSIKP